jgi:hypothetical protein
MARLSPITKIGLRHPAVNVAHLPDGDPDDQ